MTEILYWQGSVQALCRPQVFIDKNVLIIFLFLLLYAAIFVSRVPAPGIVGFSVA